MVTTLHLELKSPVAAAAGTRGVWVADGIAKTITCFNLVTGAPENVIQLAEAPLDVEVFDSQVVVSCEDGSVRMVHPQSKTVKMLIPASPTTKVLVAAPHQLWYSDGNHISWIDQTGKKGKDIFANAISLVGALNQVFWITPQKTLKRYDVNTDTVKENQLPLQILENKQMVLCSNAIWIPIKEGLLLVSIRSLRLGSILPISQNDIAHLVCDQNGRLLLGRNQLFLFDPASDDFFRKIDLPLKSDISAIVISNHIAWVFERNGTTAHILEIPI